LFKAKAQSEVKGTKKVSPLKFFAVFSATVWNFNLNFADVITEMFYIQLPNEI